MIDSILISNGKPEEYPEIDEVLHRQGFLQLHTCERCFARASSPQLLASTINRERIKRALQERVGEHLEIQFVDGDEDPYILDNV